MLTLTHKQIKTLCLLNINYYKTFNAVTYYPGQHPWIKGVYFLSHIKLIKNRHFFVDWVSIPLQRSFLTITLSKKCKTYGRFYWRECSVLSHSEAVFHQDCAKFSNSYDLHVIKINQNSLRYFFSVLITLQLSLLSNCIFAYQQQTERSQNYWTDQCRF